MLKMSAVVASLIVFASPALAAPTTLTATGKVTYIAALQNGSSVTTPNGSIRIGDAFSVSATFDLANAQVASLFDADPTINIYHLPDTTVTYSIGSFSRTFQPRFDFNASVQLWNDRLVGTSPVDAQSFDFFDYDVVPTSSLPFDLGAGSQSVSLDLNAFDNSATARNSDLITEFAPLSLFSKSFSLGQLNADTDLFVYVQGDVDTGMLSSAVPEPATWAMMILGMGAVGYAMRRQRKIAGTLAAQ